MIRSGRWVFDTSALVSRLLIPDSVPATALQMGMESGYLLVSDETLDELANVLTRSKFDRYLTNADRQQFFNLLGRVALRIEIVRHIQACRDPKDDKFLSLAVNGGADAIVTGDRDLLALHPFMGIPILKPGDFLTRAEGSP
ncbi:MAG: putative toxin-antitoxin system toxin component, PIN family [Terrimicrobiaceae bacterium]|jgi:putative PIN family toxin of toxin-antitoxin system